MKEFEARQLIEDIKALCKRHKLWICVKEEHKPELKMIRVEEISIKIEK